MSHIETTIKVRSEEKVQNLGDKRGCTGVKVVKWGTPATWSPRAVWDMTPQGTQISMASKLKTSTIVSLGSHLLLRLIQHFPLNQQRAIGWILTTLSNGTMMLIAQMRRPGFVDKYMAELQRELRIFWWLVMLIRSVAFSWVTWLPFIVLTALCCASHACWIEIQTQCPGTGFGALGVRLLLPVMLLIINDIHFVLCKTLQSHCCPRQANSEETG